ncbi:protein phosphatase 2A regulatory subunit A and related proteins [Moesziomyces antarcticus T-34]|uniref:Protein phosphatase 2A regulatory subunit A and related proteins n=1 Tax=Pseudozyma antarctica (strain T-34) TaxID=1151754 RepID=M9MC11_PSEA3|nr:protein phosphatase 2A regulatory subunit A and related proteins [Moesziomyces antarcticus T-34]
MQCPGLRLCSTALKLLDFDEPEARTHGAGHVTSPSPVVLAAMKLAMLPLASSHSHLAGPRQCVEWECNESVPKTSSRMPPWATLPARSSIPFDRPSLPCPAQLGDAGDPELDRTRKCTSLLSSLLYSALSPSSLLRAAPPSRSSLPARHVSIAVSSFHQRRRGQHAIPLPLSLPDLRLDILIPPCSARFESPAHQPSRRSYTHHPQLHKLHIADDPFTVTPPAFILQPRIVEST